jgi:hypothetical protein
MMKLVHVELREANDFVMRLHRHHKKVQGHRFSIGAKKEGVLVGVAIIGRPVGGQNQHEWVEVTRCCTDGTKNACSFLYGRAARAAAALGFKRIQTYILQEELGTSLKASGWRFERLSHPSGWHHACGRGARTVEPHLMGRKQLWWRGLTEAGEDKEE